MNSQDPKPLSPRMAAAELSVGQLLGKYKIVRKLGAGGMGTVFLAEDVELKRTVALKVLPRDRAENPILVRRFKAEGQAAAQLHHKNIVQVYEAGQIEGYLFLALEFVDGIDLLEWIRKRGPLPVKRSIEIIRQVAEALQHAYEKSIVHRDIKPSNLMITSGGKVKLADMGLARSIDETIDTSITRDGTTVGTIDYMAPEQARNSKAADIRSDIYSLGCTWYHMLTGSAPFPEGSITNKVQAHANAPRPNPRDRNPSVPSGIVAVIHRMMAPKQEDRYQTPADLIADLNNDNVSRADVMPDLLAALSTEADSRRPQKPNVVDEEDEDWEQIFRRVREPDSSEPQSFDFDLAGNGAERSQDDTREVPESPEPPKKQKPRKKRPADRPAEQVGLASGNQAGPQGDVERDRRGKPMPARSKNPESLAAPQGIEIDYLKIGLLLIGVFAFTTLLWWGWKNYFSGFGNGSDTIANPYGDAVTVTDEGTADSGVGPAAAEVPTNPAEESQRPGDASDQSAAGPDQGSVAAATVEPEGKSPEKIGQLPAWARTGWSPPPGLAKPEVRTVQRGTKYPSTGKALADLPKQGGIIEFAGIGPFYLEPATISGIEQLQFRGRPESRPVLMIRDDDLDENRALFQVNGVRVVFENIHLVYVGTHQSQAAPARLISITSGELDVTGCSVTAAGPLTEVTFCHVAKGEPSRILIEKSLFRGGRLSAIEAAGTGADLVISKSLIAVDESIPFLVSSGNSFYLQDSTCLSSTSILHFRQEAASGRKNTRIMLQRDSLIGGAGPREAAAIELSPWAMETKPRADRPQADQLEFLGTDIEFHGWSTLTSLRDEASNIVTAHDASSWRQFWRQPLPESAIHQDTERSADGKRPVHDMSSKELQKALNSDTSELLDDGIWLTGVQEKRVNAFANRRPGADPGLLASESPIRFDLSRENPQNSLQNLINSPRCPDGSRIVCFGTGVKFLNPVIIEKKRVRIDFESTGPVALDVRPNSEVEGEALFTVKGGRLELVNAPLSVPDSRSRRYAQCLLRVEAGEVVLQECQFTGPADGLAGSALIEWNPVKGERSAGTFLNSVFRGEGTLVNGGLETAEILFSNCLLLSGGNAFHLFGAQAGGELTISRSTLSAAGAVFKVEDSSEPGDWTVFAREVVFAPPLVAATDSVSKASRSVIDISDLSLKSLTWWEAGCAYAAQLTLRSSEGQPLPPAPLIELWGEGHVVDALEGGGSTVLNGVLGSQSLAKADDLLLKKGCRASSWSVDGGPIGFDVRLPGSAAAESPGTKTNQTGGPRPTRQNPGF